MNTSVLLKPALLAGLTLAGAVAHATTGPLVTQGNAALTNLSFQVVDLNPKDLVAPGFAVRTLDAQDVFLSGSSYTIASDFRRVQGTVFSSASDAVNLNSGLAVATKSGNNLSSAIAVDAQNLSDLRQIATGKYSSVWGNSVAAEATSNDQAGVDNIWVLKAGTKVTVTGTMTTNVTIDGSSFTSLSYLAQNPGSMIYLQSSALTNVTMYAVPDDPLQVPDYQVVKLEADAAQAVSSSGVIAVGSSAASQSFSQSFSLSVSNTTTKDMLVSLAMGTTAKSDWRVVPLSSSVPEPTSWALLGLGLVGLAAVARQGKNRP